MESPTPKSSGLAGKIVLIAVGISVAAMGTLFCKLLWRSYERAMLTRGWDEVPALIVRSDIITERVTPNSPLAYRIDLLYRYEYGGQNYEGTQLKMVDGRSNEKAKAESKIDSIRAGAEVTCFVDPGAPETAVLKHFTKAGLYSIWFPGLFVVGGLGITASSIRRLGKN